MPLRLRARRRDDQRFSIFSIPGECPGGARPVIWKNPENFQRARGYISMTALSIRNQRLKTATRELQRAVGGIEASAEITGKGKSQHGNYQNLSMPDFATIEAIADMEAVARGTPNYPQVTRLLCQLAGGVFVPLPEMPETDEAPALLILRLASELGGVSASITDGLADNGKIDPHEATASLAKLAVFESTAAQLRLLLQSLEAGERAEAA